MFDARRASTPSPEAAPADGVSPMSSPGTPVPMSQDERLHSALNEILNADGGMAINKPIMHHLLNRMKEFNEWSQCIVLDLLAKYQPEAQQETFDIMNLLEERLKHSNSAVVLGATKVFLNLTQDMPAVHSQVYARLKAPMLTLIAGGIFEQSFVCLKHIALLTSRAPEVFADQFKHFFCRYNDAVCI